MKDRFGTTERDSLPVIRQVPEPKTQESTTEDVGKDEHIVTR